MSINFKGNYYVTSNVNSRLPNISGCLSEMEKRCLKSQKPTFFIDGGDLMGDCCSLKSMVDSYIEFKKHSPKTQCIFNPGNWEVSFLYLNRPYLKERQSDIEKQLIRLAQNGYYIVNSTFKPFEDRYPDLKPYIKDYIILDDKIDGKDARVFITSFSNINHDQKLTDEVISKKLDEVIIPAYKKEKEQANKEGKDFKTIFIIHDGEETKSDLKTVKLAKEKGMDNIELALGAQPHDIDDCMQNNTRYLRTASNGKSIYEIKSDKDGFRFDKIEVKNNDGYDYSVLDNRDDIIYNKSDKPLSILQHYQKIINENKEFFYHPIAKLKTRLKYREEYHCPTSTPSGLGSLIATSMKDRTNSDLAVMLALDLRAPLPKVGNNVTNYDIHNIINMDNDIYIVKDVNSDGLRKIFNASFKEDKKGKQNQNFLEYSDNIKIIRYKNPVDDNKIKQIYIKNDKGEFEPLFDETGKAIYPERKFNIATTKFVADKNTRTQNRKNLEIFDLYESIPYKEKLTLRSILKDRLKELEDSDIDEFQASLLFIE